MTSSVARHRTAMSRGDLSRPLSLALADGLLEPVLTVFDYGCGRGDDLRHLNALGYQAFGWDPTYRPDAERTSADVVNLGYVVNVIENPVERSATLRAAWALTKKLLVVSARPVWDACGLVGRPYGDGILTRTGTFQKFYEQSELAAWIEETLGTRPLGAAPGIFYAFRDPTVAEHFLSTRVYSYRPRPRIDPHTMYEANEELLSPLFEFLTSHARAPRPGELDPDSEFTIADAFGSPGRAVKLIRQVTDEEHWERIARQRRAELLIYLALSRFDRRPMFSQLPQTLARDIRSLFGSYKTACIKGDRLLLACGDPDKIYISARSSEVGKQTPSSLYVHRSALAELSPLLQVYEGCARVLVGTVEEANIIKLSVTEPQVSYLSYPKFDRAPHPTLDAAVIVNLKRLSVVRRDYSQSDNPPLLHRKEEFLGKGHPRRELYARLTRAERRAGLYAHPELIGTRKGWEAVLARAGRAVRGHRLRFASPS